MSPPKAASRDNPAMFSKIESYISFARRSFGLLAAERNVFMLFIVLSVAAALTEGIGVSLLVPVLDAQGGMEGFAKIPLLNHVSSLFSAASPSEQIKTASLAIAAAIVLRAALSFLVDMLSSAIPLRFEEQLNLRSYASLMAVDIAYIHENEFGKLQNGLGGWPHAVSFVLTNCAIIFSNLMTVVVYVVLMVAVSWRLTFLAILFLALISLMLKSLTTEALNRAGARLTNSLNRLNQVVMETISGMKLIRLSASEPKMHELYARTLREVMTDKRRTAMIQALAPALLSACAGLFICALLYGSATLQLDNPGAWVGSILLFLFLLFRLMTPVSSINNARNRIINHMPAFEMLETFYADTAVRRQKNGRLPAPPLRSGVTFEGVSFAYKDGEKVAVANLSTTIEQGRVTAVVGPSGSGKSTLIALITRLYDPQSGCIRIDGVDLRELDVRSWRKRVAVVTQDTFIFNNTVTANIGFGQSDVSMDRIRAAAQLAAADEFIERLPHGYATVLGDRGVSLSGGQQQRIAIARAILTDPNLLIFDEATSNLDTFTEREIQRAMEHLSNGRTLLVIAHRLSTIRKADKVIVMEDGHIVEEGPHKNLLGRRGRYWEMVEHQRLDLVESDAVQAFEESHA